MTISQAACSIVGHYNSWAPGPGGYLWYHQNISRSPCVHVCCSLHRNTEEDLGAHPIEWPLLVFISRDLQEITSPIRTRYTDRLEHYLMSDCSTSGTVLYTNRTR
jgi:hypothetical protein